MGQQGGCVSKKPAESQDNVGESGSDSSASDLSRFTFEVVEPASGRKPRKGIYLLPNLFTTAALFCGFYTIISSFNGQFEKAGIALFMAGLFDGMDGRVARLTNTQSAFGAQYDSMSDLVAFGVAPAMMIYAWSLSALGKLGWVVSFFFVACAALRLARFNVQVEEESGHHDFLGLPSPAAAGVVGFFVWASADMVLQGVGWSATSALVTLLAAGLMVSNVRYPSFKELDARNRVPFVSILVMVLLIGVISLDPPRVLVLFAWGYGLLGILLIIRAKWSSPMAS